MGFSDPAFPAARARFACLAAPFRPAAASGARLRPPDARLRPPDAHLRPSDARLRPMRGGGSFLSSLVSSQMGYFI